LAGSPFGAQVRRHVGKVVYDKDAKSGSIEVTVDVSSINFGMPKLNEHAKSAEMFDAAKYPTATLYRQVHEIHRRDAHRGEGTLTMHGVTKPVTLKIDSFKCMQNPTSKKEVWRGPLPRPSIAPISA